MRFVTNAERAAAAAKLAAMLPPNVTAVAGVARSGLAPAGQIAELLHLRLLAVSQRGELTPLPTGARGESTRAADEGLLAIVDDTVASGRAMRTLTAHRERIGRPCLLAAVFANPEAGHLVDLYAERLELPHYLGWNLFNSIFTAWTALDFDGILCRDCRPAEDDDGPNYLRFLERAEPRHLPRRSPVPLIVTARLEKWRAETEAWLTRWGVRWHELRMGPWGTLAERQRAYDPAEFKGRAYRESACKLFVESCPWQAAAIAEASGKRVICPATGQVWN